MAYTLTINGKSQTVDVAPDMPLLWVLRDTLHLKGTKFGCGIGAVRRVHRAPRRPAGALVPDAGVDGRQRARSRPSKACRPTARIRCSAPGRQIDVPQCGYCQAGQLMSAAALLASIAKPTDADIDTRDDRQPLPLRHLPAHPPGDSPRGRRRRVPPQSAAARPTEQ